MPKKSLFPRKFVCNSVLWDTWQVGPRNQVRTLRNINPQGLSRSGRHRCHFGFCWRCLGGRHCHCGCGRLCDGWCHGCPHRAQHRSWGPWWDIDDWNLHRRQKGQKETGSNFDALDIFGHQNSVVNQTYFDRRNPIFSKIALFAGSQ